MSKNFVPKKAFFGAKAVFQSVGKKLPRPTSIFFSKTSHHTPLDVMFLKRR
jgi:hypothetical protein